MDQSQVALVVGWDGLWEKQGTRRLMRYDIQSLLSICTQHAQALAELT